MKKRAIIIICMIACALSGCGKEKTGEGESKKVQENQFQSSVQELKQRKNATIFSKYLELVGNDYSEISDQYVDTITSNTELDGFAIETHSIEKEFTELPGKWKIFYNYYDGEKESYENGSLPEKLSMPYLIGEGKKKSSEILEKLEREYGKYDEDYEIPFNTESNEEQIQCYQWDSVEANYGMTLTVENDRYKITFSHELEVFDKQKILQPVYEENENLEKQYWEQMLNSYKRERVESLWNVRYEEAQENLETMFQNGYQIKENVLECFRVNNYAAWVWTEELGKSAGALLLDKEEEYFLVHVNFEISNEKEEKAVDDYILVGKVNDNWKICNMPAVLNLLDDISF